MREPWFSNRASALYTSRVDAAGSQTLTDRLSRVEAALELSRLPSRYAMALAEHEDGTGWYVITMRYDDVYERRDGNWYFVRRREHPWYSVDVTERPGPDFIRWPADVELRAAMPQRMESWRRFWEEGDPALPARLSTRP